MMISLVKLGKERDDLLFDVELVKLPISKFILDCRDLIPMPCIGTCGKV